MKHKMPILLIFTGIVLKLLGFITLLLIGPNPESVWAYATVLLILGGISIIAVGLFKFAKENRNVEDHRNSS
jgi:MFS superfamily sulfate permease-like transporter